MHDGVWLKAHPKGTPIKSDLYSYFSVPKRTGFRMKTTLVIFSYILLCCSRLSAQDTARLVDRVFTSDDKVYVGQITDDKKGDYLSINVYQTGTYIIEYKTITKIQYGVDNPRYVAHGAAKEPKGMRAVYQDTSSGLDLVAFNGYRAAPRVTDKLIKKRNIGIGLTIAGVCMVGVGAAIYATTPRQSNTSSGGYQLVTPSAGSIAGVLMMIVGTGITIPGVALWGSFAHKIHKAEQQN